MEPGLLNIWEPKGPIRITTFAELLAHANEFMTPREQPKREVNRFLFRGTSDASHELLPSLPRSVGSKTSKVRPWLTRQLLYHIEEQSTKQFIIKARLYIDE